MYHCSFVQDKLKIKKFQVYNNNQVYLVDDEVQSRIPTSTYLTNNSLTFSPILSEEVYQKKKKKPYIIYVPRIKDKNKK